MRDLGVDLLLHPDRLRQRGQCVRGGVFSWHHSGEKHGWGIVQVFVTCGSLEKRRLLLSTFPGLRADHIGDSRSTSFEELVMRVTGGAGVDLALNSLAADKLQVPHCLMYHV